MNNEKNYDVQYLNEKEVNSVIAVDDKLDLSSTKPVQNKVIYAKFLEQEQRIANNEANNNTAKIGIAENKQAIADINNARGSSIATLVNGKIPTSQLPDVVFGQVAWRGIITGLYESQPKVSLSYEKGAENLIDINLTRILPTRASIQGGTLDPNTWFVPRLGDYFINNAQAFTWDGVTLEKGDWLIWQGGVNGWGKVDNTDAVSSVAGLTGTITIEQLREKLGVYSKTELDNAVNEAVTNSVNEILNTGY